jgi:hypothetical protein
VIQITLPAETLEKILIQKKGKIYKRKEKKNMKKQK